MVIKLENEVTYYENILPVKSNNPLSTWSHDRLKYCISTTTRPLATKLGKMVTFYEKLPPRKSRNPLNTLSRVVTWQNRYYISTTAMTMATKGVGWSSLDHIIFQFHVTNYVVSTIIRPLAIKRDKVITCYHGFPPIKSRNAWDTWSFEIM